MRLARRAAFLKAGQLAELNDAQRPKRIDLVRIQV